MTLVGKEMKTGNLNAPLQHLYLIVNACRCSVSKSSFDIFDIPVDVMVTCCIFFNIFVFNHIMTLYRNPGAE